MTRSAAIPRDSNFACAYAMAVAPGDERSSEEWARAAWEGAPPPLRWFMLAGWRFVLGLSLGPRQAPDHILGWHVVDRLANETVCHLRSRSMTAYNTFRLSDNRLEWSTFVVYENAAAKYIWLPTSLVHRVLVRYALRHAGRRA